MLLPRTAHKSPQSAAGARAVAGVRVMTDYPRAGVPRVTSLVCFWSTEGQSWPKLTKSDTCLRPARQVGIADTPQAVELVYKRATAKTTVKPNKARVHRICL